VPYQKPGFYDEAIAKGRHRDIVGGRWDETGRAQMALLIEGGLRPEHVLLDVGAGSLRLGCKAVPYLERGHYWATDASSELMLAGHARELADPSALDVAHLLHDAAFEFEGAPNTITHAIAFGVFPHLPIGCLATALANLNRFPALEAVFFTVFLAPEGEVAHRQNDGVVTHDLKPPFHVRLAQVLEIGVRTGWDLQRQDRILPRGQVLFIARR
jgi:hypothetical protein